MAFKLVVTQPFHGYEKGQEITDQAEVARLSEDREHHFVRVFYEPAPEAPAQPEPLPATATEHHDV
jgi:hypothetical protein